MRFFSLAGTIGYEEARKFQKELVEKRAADRIPDTVLFLEHEPVVTRGRGLQWTGEERPRHAPLGPLPKGIDFCESERGGDLTYHGPGQLVIYPIVKLGQSLLAPKKDVQLFLRNLENILIRQMDRLGLKARAHENATGVWVGDKKIASIGIAVKKWVSYHGIAINVVNDLSPFRLISPCGFSPDVMTRLQDLTNVEPDWRPWLEKQFISLLASKNRDVVLGLAK